MKRYIAVLSIVILIIFNMKAGMIHAATLNGGEGNDRLIGSNSADTINARGGTDFIEGRGGADIISGGAGGDTIYGGEGNDDIEGDFAGYRSLEDIITLTITPNDMRTGSPDGLDTIVDINVLRFADGDQEVVIAGLEIIGDDSNEELNGGPNADRLDGAGGDDTIDGDTGNDTLLGGEGSDTLIAGSGK